MNSDAGACGSAPSLAKLESCRDEMESSPKSTAQGQAGQGNKIFRDRKFH
jgi:hypothetical protein